MNLNFETLIEVDSYSYLLLNNENYRKVARLMLEKITGKNDALDYFLSFRVDNDKYLSEHLEEREYWSKLYDQNIQFYYILICFYIEQGFKDELLCISNLISEMDRDTVAGDFVLRKAVKTNNPRMIELGYYMVFNYWYDDFHYDEDGFHVLNENSELSELDALLSKYFDIDELGKAICDWTFQTFWNGESRAIAQVDEFLGELKALVFS